MEQNIFLFKPNRLQQFSVLEPFKPQPPNLFVQCSYTRRLRMDRLLPLDKHILYHYHQFVFAHPGNSGT
jgi:hypothetical protein